MSGLDRYLGKLGALLERLSDVPARTAALAAPQFTALLQDGFRAGTDPYGRAWAQLRPATLRKGRRPPPLSDTYALRNGTKVRPRPGQRAGLTLVVGANYARFHQTGTRLMVARHILPQKGMPASWRAVLQASARKAGQAALVGARGAA